MCISIIIMYNSIMITYNTEINEYVYFFNQIYVPYLCFSQRILFPLLSGKDQNVSQMGLTKLEGYSDPDDYVDIESGQ